MSYDGISRGEGMYREQYEERDYYRKPEKKRRDEEQCECDKHHPKPKKILLECGDRPSDAVFKIHNGYVHEHQTFVLDRVLVDTSRFCKPLVKIEFSSLVAFEAETRTVNGAADAPQSGDVEAKTQPNYNSEIEVELLFELIRVCDGKEERLQSWTFKKEFEVNYGSFLEVEISEPFTVTFCDRVCPECCEYKMKVTGKDFEGDFDFATVTKPDISALAQDSCCECGE